MVDLVNELEGKVAIVTGSARNIGRATAVELARAGASLIINARESKVLCEEVAHAIEANGGRAIPVIADITDRDAVGRMVETAVQTFGGVDILVNNAAVRANVGFVDLEEETWQRSIDTSIQGAFNTCKACIPHMIERGGGSVISVAGMASHQGVPRRAHVMASKDGLIGLTRGLAIDLGPQNIRSNVVVVGVFDTERGANAPVSGHAPDVSIPMGRKGVPQDMADLIRFLAGPGAAYISGQTIHCNGAAYCPH